MSLSTTTDGRQHDACTNHTEREPSRSGDIDCDVVCCVCVVRVVRGNLVRCCALACTQKNAARVMRDLIAVATMLAIFLLLVLLSWVARIA
jgi:hypothetical protein